jgi:hypothetical protein
MLLALEAECLLGVKTRRRMALEVVVVEESIEGIVEDEYPSLVLRLDL